MSYLSSLAGICRGGTAWVVVLLLCRSYKTYIRVRCNHLGYNLFFALETDDIFTSNFNDLGLEFRIARPMTRFSSLHVIVLQFL